MRESQKRLHGIFRGTCQPGGACPGSRVCRPRQPVPLLFYMFTRKLPTVHPQCIVLLKGLRDSVRHDDGIESNVGQPGRGKANHDPAEPAREPLSTLRRQALED